MNFQSIGKLGEAIAYEYLHSLGYKIIEQNYRTKLGELDIVAEKKDKVYFIEVKTRVGDLHGKPYEAVTPRKLSHIRRVAQVYLLEKKIINRKLSIQVIGIVLNTDQSVKTLRMYEVI